MVSPRQRGWPVPAWLIQASDGADPRRRGEVFLSSAAPALKRGHPWIDAKYLHGYIAGDRAVPCTRGDAPLSTSCHGGSLPDTAMSDL
jgi:hypothetical protein